MACPACGATVPEGARFCPSCGLAQAGSSDERRIATVLFADIVGFTALSESRDPEQVKNLVDGCFERLVTDITSFGGIVDKILGDAIVALFGAPVAHEDDPERAVRAALAMQDSLRTGREEVGDDVRMRIGINTGEVLVGSVRGGGYTAMGDVVNTAQRLQAAADPNTVVVGRATYLATRRVIAYEGVGPLPAKGKDEPVDAWRATGAILPPGYRQRRHTPLIGREDELGMLTHAVDSAIGRSRAHLVLLLGEAGVGKTRLAEEVAETADCTHGAVVLEGRCVPYGEANVWWPVAEAIRQACDIATTDSLEVADARIRERVADAFGRPGDDPEVGRVAAGLLHLLGREGWSRDLDPGRAREEAVRALVAFVEAAAQRLPVVLVLSDLHWADEVVLELLGDLLERVAREQVVVVATARRELLDRWQVPSGRHNALVVNLDPLDRNAADRLLASLVEGELPRDVRTLLLDRSGGNPFFLEEFVALIGEAGRAPSADGRTIHGLSDGLPDTLPDTLRGLVSARLDSLSDPEKRTLEDAAVWGRAGPIEAIQKMAAALRSDTDIAPALDRLVAKDLLLVEGPTWSFRSDLVRDVAYSTLTKGDRARRHHGIASYLEQHAGCGPVDADERLVDTVAYHYGAAAELVVDLGGPSLGRDDPAVLALPWVIEAARRAGQSKILPVATRLYSQGLRLAGPGASSGRIELLLGRAAALAEMRRGDEAEVDIAEAERDARALHDESGLARVALVRGQMYQQAGEMPAALDAFDDAIVRFRALGDDAGVAESLRGVGLTQLFQADMNRAEAAIGEAYDLSRAIGDRRGEAWAAQQLAWIGFVRGEAEVAETRIRDALTTFDELDDQAGLAWATGLLAFVRFQQGQLVEAEPLAEQVLAQARERGDAWGEGMMGILGASIRLWSGRSTQAVPRAEEALGAFRRIGDGFGQVQALAVLGRALVATGRIADGFRVLDEAARPDAPTPEIAGMGSTALAGAALHVGDAARAEAALAAIDADWVDSHNLADVERLVATGLVHLQQDSVELAVEALERAVELSERSSAYATAALALARAASGDGAGVDELVHRLAGLDRTSYLDRFLAASAELLAEVTVDGRGAVTRFDAVVRELDVLDDQVTQAVARLFRGMALATLVTIGTDAESRSTDVDAQRAESERTDAESRLAELGIEAAGWRTLAERILATHPATLD